MKSEEKAWDWTSKGEEVKKRILKEGKWDGLRPIEGSKCIITIDKVEGDWVPDLKIGERESILIGDNDSKMERLIERCLRTMDKGEESVVSMGDVSCRLTLQSYDVPDTAAYEYDLQEAIEKAGIDKEKGNVYFKKGKFEEAYNRFTDAVKILIFAEKTNEQILPLYLNICNNIALCHLKLKNPELAIEVCNKVIEHDKNNIKALFRRCTGYHEIRDFERAYEDIVEVIKLAPHDPEATNLFKIIVSDVNEMNKRYKDMVKNMFKKN